MNIENDTQYEEKILTNVNTMKEGWEISHGPWTLFVHSDQCQQPPKVGEKCRLYGRGVGYTVRGIVIEGRVYRYLTEEQDEQHHQAQLDADREKRQRDLDDHRAERDAAIAVLPEPFRIRIEHFQKARPDWRREHEPYEFFCCQEAVKIANAVRPMGLPWDKAIHAFYSDRDMQEIAKISRDHSGNTFGTACRLAHCYLEAPDRLPMLHGALCPLVGCEEYGCYAAAKGAA
jgi:hypothetical protein